MDYYNRLDPEELAQIPFFYDIEECDLKALSEIIRVRNVMKNKYIFKEGDSSSEMYIILEGTVNILKTNKKENEELLAQIKSPQVFGEIALISRGRRSASAYAVTDLILAELSCYKFEQLIEINPRAAVNVVKKIASTLSSRLRQINSAYVDIVHP
ncbi:MAG: hypothetical protein A2104_03250 [Candidatus Melainabacteria bacterium GWF2_32_7]|nr:MAG: hypothetical protein A2104_03250 [Candidatus Melainabacteria bacterium GWF2_32_7]